MESQTGGSGRPVRGRTEGVRGWIVLSPCGPATADARVAKHNGHIEFNVQSGRFYPRPPMNGFIHIAMANATTASAPIQTGSIHIHIWKNMQAHPETQVAMLTL